MAKNTAPKKSAARQFAEQDAPQTKATRNRGAVLLKITASKLHELIGDTPIGVSHRELKDLVLKAKSSEVLAEAGI